MKKKGVVPMSRNMTAAGGLLFGLLIVAGLASAQDEAQRDGVRLRFTPGPKPYTVTVSGKVTDERTGEPIAGASVRGHIFVWGFRSGGHSDRWNVLEKSPYRETNTDAAGAYQLVFETPLTTSGRWRGRMACASMPVLQATKASPCTSSPKWTRGTRTSGTPTSPLGRAGS